MRIVVEQSPRQSPLPLEAPLVVVPVPEDEDARRRPALAALDRRAGGLLSAAWDNGWFRGRRHDRLPAYGRAFSDEASDALSRSDAPAAGSSGAFQRLLFLGVGPRPNEEPGVYRELGGRAVRAAEALAASSLAVCAAHLDGDEGDSRPGHELAEGLALAAWRYDELKDDPVRVAGRPVPPVESATIFVGDGGDWKRGAAAGTAYAEAENFARTLQARPGNVATPSRLADEARRMAARFRLECQVLGPKEMEAENMGALLSVARGSDQPPCLIVLRHEGAGPDAPRLALVGKGLTFDAGGISIKPAKGMEEMKYDMSGGAAVLGAMQAVGRLRASAHVIGVVPCSENLLNGSANKPGDVVRARAGKTIEVINTDAEGRLILADALHYAAEWKPHAMVDCATLTGACVVALGRHRSAVLGSDRALVESLIAAGEAADQRCWELPMDKEYRKQLDSPVADLKNVGGRDAGTITAACFLSEFVQGVPWAHLDIAGTAYGKTKKPYLRNGALGSPTRLLVEWVAAQCDWRADPDDDADMWSVWNRRVARGPNWPDLGDDGDDARS